MARDIVRVFQVGNTWMVTYRNGSESQGFGTKQAAESFAKTTAAKRRPCVLVVMNQESIIEYEMEF
jgi:hypothetical protein